MNLSKSATYNMVLQDEKIRTNVQTGRYVHGAAINWNCCSCGKEIYSRMLLYDSPSMIYCDKCYDENIRIYRGNHIIRHTNDRYLVLNPYQSISIMRLRQKQYAMTQPTKEKNQ